MANDMDWKNFELEQFLRVVREEAEWSSMSASKQGVRQTSPPLPSLSLPAWPHLKELYTVRPAQREILDASEFLGMDDVNFIHFAYQALLGRQADETGLANYLSLLRKGEYRQLVISELQRSPEAVNGTSKVKGVEIFRVLKGRLFRRRLINKVSTFLLDLIDSYQQSKALKQLFRLHLNVARTTSDFSAVAEKSINVVKEHLKQSDRVLSEQAQTLEAINSLVQNFQSQLRRIEAQSLHTPTTAQTQTSSVTSNSSYMSSEMIDRFYVAFEDKCRGDETQLHSKLKSYLDFLPQSEQGLVVDFGCGRGEWLEILTRAKYKAIGIDANNSMIELCQSKSLEVFNQDIIEYLAGLEPDTLTGFTGFHVAEHIPLDLLLRVFYEAHRALKPGGVIILETPNPENLLVASHTFYHDPTHRNPLTPTFMTFCAEYFGFKNILIHRMNPYPESARVRGIDPLTDRVNGHLLGPQDFALIASK